MPHHSIAESVASRSTCIGPDAAKHLDLLWRDLMRAQGSVEDELSFRLITGQSHPLGNLAILRDASQPGLIARVVGPLRDLALPAGVLCVAGIGEPAARQLVSLGFSHQSEMPAMAVDLASLAPTQLPSGYEFFRVSAGADGMDWTDVVAAGFELPRDLARMLSPQPGGASQTLDARTQYFGVRREGCLVATSMLYLAGGLAGIYCVATLPHERGRGLGAHVTAEALRAASRLGYRVGVLQSSPAGHSIYLDLGFRDVGSVRMFIRMPD